MQSQRDRAAHERRVHEMDENMRVTNPAAWRRKHPRPRWLPQCPRQKRFVSRSCGHRQKIYVGCGNPFCIECERKRSAERLDAWANSFADTSTQPADVRELAKFGAKHIVLTTANGNDAEATIDETNRNLRKMLDTRLGPRNMERLENELRRLATQNGNDDAWTECEIASLRKWRADMPANFGPSPKFRQTLTGIAGHEVTTPEDEFHSHLHILAFTRFIPQSTLSAMLSLASNGKSYMTRIRAVKATVNDVFEVVKYLTKPNDTPPEPVARELAEAMKGRRRLTRIGNIRATKPKRQPCPKCERTDCRTHFVANVNATESKPILRDGKVTIESVTYMVRGMSEPFTEYFADWTDKKGNHVWCAGDTYEHAWDEYYRLRDETPKADETSFVHLIPLVSREVLAVAVAPPPTPPRAPPEFGTPEPDTGPARQKTQGERERERRAEECARHVAQGELELI